MNIQSKKGMSAIITTVILVALAMVAVLIVWGVVSNILTDSEEDINSQAACINSNLNIESVSQSGSNVDVIVKRTRGDDTIGGVKIVAYLNDDTAKEMMKAGNVGTLGVAKATFDNLATANIKKVAAVIYFKDADGNDQLCQNVVEKDIN